MPISNEGSVNREGRELGMCMSLGALTLQTIGAKVEVQGEDCKGVEASGIATVYDVIDRDAGLHHTLHDIEWDSGARDVRSVSRNGSGERYDTLISRLRLPVLPHPDGHYVALRKADVRANGRARLVSTTLQELTDLSGVYVSRALLSNGVHRITTRGVLFPGESTHKNLLVAQSSGRALAFPVIAFVLTRIAPVRRHFEGQGPDLAVAA